MTEHKAEIKKDRDRAWDWLTALSPVLMMMVVNYRGQAVGAVLSAAAGWFVMTVVWYHLKLTAFRPVLMLLCGVLVGCCLPAAAPWWLAALAGGLAASVAVIPATISRFFPSVSLTCPVCFPALSGYLMVRWLFASRFSGFALPVMWTGMDTVASATPLASLGGELGEESLLWLFWGLRSGSMGGGPAPAILLAGLFLLLRRRLRPLPTAAMLGLVALLSAVMWDMALYGLLAGGTLLAAMLLGDETFICVGWKGQITAGLLAGAVTVLCRAKWSMDGAALGVVAACLLIPLLHIAYHKIWDLTVVLWEKFVKSKNKG